MVMMMMMYLQYSFFEDFAYNSKTVKIVVFVQIEPIHYDTYLQYLILFFYPHKIAYFRSVNRQNFDTLTDILLGNFGIKTV